MASPKVWWDVAKKCFTVGLISLTISDRFCSITHILGHSMSPTFNPAHSTFDGKCCVLMNEMLLTFFYWSDCISTKFFFCRLCFGGEILPQEVQLFMR